MSSGWPQLGTDIVALCPWGADGETPVIAVHCRSLDDSDLFSTMTPVVQMTGVDTDDSGTDEAVTEALKLIGGAWSQDCFCILSVREGIKSAGIVAVGLGSNVKKRTRASRLALAVSLSIREGWQFGQELEPVVRQAGAAIAAAPATFRAAWHRAAAETAAAEAAAAASAATGLPLGTGSTWPVQQPSPASRPAFAQHDATLLGRLAIGSWEPDPNPSWQASVPSSWGQEEKGTWVRVAAPEIGSTPETSLSWGLPAAGSEVSWNELATSGGASSWVAPASWGSATTQQVKIDPGAPKECVEDQYAEMRPWSNSADGTSHLWPYCTACGCWSDVAHLYGQKHQKNAKVAQWWTEDTTNDKWDCNRPIGGGQPEVHTYLGWPAATAVEASAPLAATEPWAAYTQHRQPFVEQQLPQDSTTSIPLAPCEQESESLDLVPPPPPPGEPNPAEQVTPPPPPPFPEDWLEEPRGPLAGGSALGSAQVGTNSRQPQQQQPQQHQQQQQQQQQQQHQHHHHHQRQHPTPPPLPPQQLGTASMWLNQDFDRGEIQV